MAKGSDKWGEGSGPRLEIVLAALVVVSLAGVAFYYFENSGLTSGVQVGKVETVSTTGLQCNSDSMPQVAQTAQQDPGFASLSNGLCYNYVSEGPVQADGARSLYFAYYDGTITYPCGTSPQELPASVIQVLVTAAQKVGSAQFVSPSTLGIGAQEPCDLSVPIKVVAVADVESTIPAVPQLNVTLAVPPGGRPITSLEAVLTLDGGSQTFKFGSVTTSAPLTSPRAASSIEIVLSDLSFTASEVYPMTVSGTFDDGQTFSVPVHVQIAQVP